MRAVEDVVAERQRGAIGADELAANQERLREPFRRWLHGILDVEPDLGPVAQQALEAVLLVRRRDDQDVADAGEHQRRQRVVEQRLVVDRDQLLADGARDGMQPGARAACQNDAFDHRRTAILTGLSEMSGQRVLPRRHGDARRGELGRGQRAVLRTPRRQRHALERDRLHVDRQAEQPGRFRRDVRPARRPGFTQ